MAELLGATALVDPAVLAMGRRIIARAGMRVAVVSSGYRPGSITVNGTLSLHAHRPAEAIDIAATGRTLSRLGRAALAELGQPNGPAAFAGVVNGWEVAYGGDFAGWGDHTTHLHLGRKAMATAPIFPGLPNPGHFDFAALMQLWVNAGGPRDSAAMAAQVASLESGGDPNARLHTIREDSRGLWQINVKAHPQYRNANLYDPAVNVRAAIAISNNGRSWSPWSTAAAARAALAIRGPVKPPDRSRPGGDSGGGGFLGGVGGAIGGAFGGAAGVVGSGADAVWGELKGVTEWATALVKFIGFLVDPKNWLRLVEMLVGISLILLGLATLIVEFAKQDSAIGGASRGVVKAAQRVTPTGRLAAYYRRRGTSRGPSGYRPPKRERISTKPTPVYRTPSSSSGPSDEIPF